MKGKPVRRNHRYGPLGILIPAGFAILFLAGCTAPPSDSRSDQAGGASLDDIAWLSGCWAGEQQEVRREECWMPPAGDIMLGMHRDLSASGRVSFEYLRIDAGPDGIIYHASPQGGLSTAFRLSGLEPTRVVFENPGHDFPRKILYFLDVDGNLHARVEGERDGEPAAEEWVWEPADFIVHGGFRR